MALTTFENIMYKKSLEKMHRNACTGWQDIAKIQIVDIDVDDTDIVYISNSISFALV